MKGQKVDEETDSARPFEGKGEFYLLQMKTPIESEVIMDWLYLCILGVYSV